MRRPVKRKRTIMHKAKRGELFLAVRALLESSWRPGGVAFDRAGNVVEADSDDAVAYSISGAIQRVIGVTQRACLVELVLSCLWALHRREAILAWEDEPGRTKEEVLALIDAAVVAQRAGLTAALTCSDPTPALRARFERAVCVLQLMLSMGRRGVAA